MEGSIRSLGSITTAEKTKAFEKTRDESSISKKGELVLIREKHYDAALKFVKESYISHEPLQISLGLKYSAEYEALYRAIFSQGLSLMLINPQGGDVMALRAITIQKRDDRFPSDVKDIPLNELCKYCQYCDDNMPINFFDKYGVKEAFHFFGLAVGETYKKQGIGQLMIEVTIDFLQNFGVEPLCIKVEGTSNFSKKIFEKTGFDILFEYKFQDYVVDGQVIFRDTGDHKSLRMYGKLLSKKML